MGAALLAGLRLTLGLKPLIKVYSAEKIDLRDFRAWRINGPNQLLGGNASGFYIENDRFMCIRTAL